MQPYLLKFLNSKSSSLKLSKLTTYILLLSLVSSLVLTFYIQNFIHNLNKEIFTLARESSEAIKSQNQENLLSSKIKIEQKIQEFKTGVLGTFPLVCNNCRQHQQNLDKLLNSVENNILGIEVLQSAKRVAMDAALKTQNPPHTVEVWNRAKNQWQEAIKLLNKVPKETSVFIEVQERLKTYEINLLQVNKRIAMEEKAVTAYQDSVNLAKEAEEKSKSDDELTLQEAQSSIKKAMSFVSSIPKGTTVSKDTETLYKQYLRQYNSITQQITIAKKISSDSEPTEEDKVSESSISNSNSQNGSWENSELTEEDKISESPISNSNSQNGYWWNSASSSQKVNLITGHAYALSDIYKQQESMSTITNNLIRCLNSFYNTEQSETLNVLVNEGVIGCAAFMGYMDKKH